MSQVTTRRCQADACRRPLVTIDHGEAYPLEGVQVLCFDPMEVRCPRCGKISRWIKEVVTGAR